MGKPQAAREMFAGASRTGTIFRSILSAPTLSQFKESRLPERFQLSSGGVGQDLFEFIFLSPIRKSIHIVQALVPLYRRALNFAENERVPGKTSREAESRGELTSVLTCSKSGLRK